MDIVIKNGTVVNAGDSFKADVGIRNGKIIALGESLSGTENIDATGKYVLPGLIEIHSDLESTFGHTRSIDNFFKGSQAAACGGFTTVIDRVVPQPDESLAEALQNRVDLAEPQMAVDYSFHLTLNRQDDSLLQEVPQLVDMGYPSFEIYFSHWDPAQAVSSTFLLPLAQSLQETNGMLLLNGGSQNMLEYLRKHYPLNPEADALPDYHRLWPPEQEAAALLSALSHLAVFNTPAYFHNLSSAVSLQIYQQYRYLLSRSWAGTSLHYLTHTADVYQQTGARNYTVSPPLRSEHDRQQLWHALKTGQLNVLSSSHRAFTQEQKKLGHDLASIPAGLANLAMVLPVLYHKGVGGKKLSLTQLVGLLSEQPAQIFGLANKGAVAVGKDADLVIFDPLEKHVLSSSLLHSESNFCAYEGLEVEGFIEMTLSRGKIVCESGRFVGEQGAGQRVHRQA